MGDRKNKLQEKNKLAALDKELNELENEYGLLCSRVKELEEDVENTEGDIQNRIEQIDRRTEELMSQNEKIKALDDEKEELKLKLSGEVTDDSGEQLNDLMNQLQSEQQYGSRPNEWKSNPSGARSCATTKKRTQEYRDSSPWHSMRLINC